MSKPTLNSQLLYRLLLLLLAILVIGSFMGVFYGHQSFIARNEELAALKVESGALEEQERSLAKAKVEIEKYEDLEQIANSVVQQEKDQTRTVRELVAIAQSLGIEIGSVSFPTSSLGEERKNEGPVTQVEPVKEIPGLYRLNVSVGINSKLSYNTLVLFLQRLESNRRTSEISSITITPTEDALGETYYTLSMELSVFIKP